MVIVGIQNLNDIACKVFLFYGFLIISLVKGIQAEALYRCPLSLNAQRLN